MCAVQASKDLKLSRAIFFLLTKKIYIKAQNLKLTYFAEKTARVALLYAENTRYRKCLAYSLSKKLLV